MHDFVVWDRALSDEELLGVHGAAPGAALPHAADVVLYQMGAGCGVPCVVFDDPAAAFDGDAATTAAAAPDHTLYLGHSFASDAPRTLVRARVTGPADGPLSPRAGAGGQRVVVKVSTRGGDDAATPFRGHDVNAATAAAAEASVRTVASALIDAEATGQVLDMPFAHPATGVHHAWVEIPGAPDGGVARVAEVEFFDTADLGVQTEYGWAETQRAAATRTADAQACCAHAAGSAEATHTRTCDASAAGGELLIGQSALTEAVDFATTASAQQAVVNPQPPNVWHHWTFDDTLLDSGTGSDKSDDCPIPLTLEEADDHGFTSKLDTVGGFNAIKLDGEAAWLHGGEIVSANLVAEHPLTLKGNAGFTFSFWSWDLCTADNNNDGVHDECDESYVLFLADDEYMAGTYADCSAMYFFRNTGGATTVKIYNANDPGACTGYPQYQDAATCDGDHGTGTWNPASAGVNHYTMSDQTPTSNPTTSVVFCGHEKWCHVTYVVDPAAATVTVYRPSQFRGTPDCNESAALHSYGLDAHCR